MRRRPDDGHTTAFVGRSASHWWWVDPFVSGVTTGIGVVLVLYAAGLGAPR